MLCIKLYTKMRVLTRFSWSVTRSILGSYSKVPKSLSTSSKCLHREHSSKTDPTPRQYIKKGPGLEYFLYNSNKSQVATDTGKTDAKEKHPYIKDEALDGSGLKVFVEVYGCQMNVNDTEIVHGLLEKHNYIQTQSVNDANIVLLMTCAIREGAEFKIWQRLSKLRAMKRDRLLNKEPPMTIGVIGCMAERLKDKLLERDNVDIIAGPDSYRSLPYLLSQASSHQAAIDVVLSLDETYADVMPVRLNPKSPSAYISIMRGCDNMCSYCIVPFTRGRERSRPVDSIINEIRFLSEQGIKEVTLLGQNVNSYRDTSESVHYQEPAETRTTSTVTGFKTVYKPKVGGRRFADLLDKVSLVDPEMRIRFTSPHPKDFPDEVLELIRDRPNICKSLHLPAQSGSNRILDLMRRNYTREAYLALVEKVLSVCGEQVTLSSDFICGFCSETEKDFEETLDLFKRVSYSTAFIFAYSVREKTTAHRRYSDDIPLETKNERCARLNQAFRQGAEKVNRKLIGSTQLVLVEGESKRSDEYLAGRCDGNVRVIFPKKLIMPNGGVPEHVKPGDYVAVKIHDATSQVLKGNSLYKTSLTQFSRQQSEQQRNNISADAMT